MSMDSRTNNQTVLSTTTVLSVLDDSYRKSGHNYVVLEYGRLILELTRSMSIITMCIVQAIFLARNGRSQASKIVISPLSSAT